MNGNAPKVSSSPDIEAKENPDRKQLELILKALSEPHRMDIFLLLKKKGATSFKILETLTEMSSSNLSHHLELLEFVGLIKNEKVGRNSFYLLNTPGMNESFRLMSILFSL
jgi:DNA-binding transcriptional ArsR family regulator